ncbi:MAG: carboxypeptidase regulatory-like domain-containing protein, partial [Anaerolineae bacterium]|nr:carboxypeptidase regulatory-like domain-containing protein [Anaerolineae bacterium]
MRHKRRVWLAVLAAALILSGLVILSMAFPVEAQGGWGTECVDCPKNFYNMTDRSLALDGAGHPHIAYGRDHLYHAYHDGTAWHYETVDASPGVGQYTALTLDGSGYPYISYYDSTNGDLKYAYEDGTGWHIETVDSGGGVGWYTSLVLDGSGYPHISYYNDTNGDLKYAYEDGT